jgi:pSer/pThr/pTyr-binding forkhead associated (FHA) protein
MKAQILWRRPGATRSFDLPEGEAILGREAGAVVALALEGISPRHARVTWDGKNHWIEDLKGTDGTLLNGHSVQRDKLRHLDVISLGKQVDLLFVKRGLGPTVTKQGVRAVTLKPLAPDQLPIEVPLGETSLGRNPACNVVLDNAAISKMHACLERTAEQVIVRDLDSANGTFVNGARVAHSALRDQDLLSLAGVEDFRVALRTGEVVTTATDGPADTQATAPVPRFSSAWKTRIEWSQDEKDAVLERQPAPSVASEGETLRPGSLRREEMPRIAEVRLTGTGFDFAVGEPGIHPLGRSAEAALRVDHVTVSRQHARLILTEDRTAALIQDLGGANGTLLNGAPLKKAEPLAEGDVVQLGDVKLRVQIQSRDRH